MRRRYKLAFFLGGMAVVATVLYVMLFHKHLGNPIWSNVYQVDYHASSGYLFLTPINQTMRIEKNPLQHNSTFIMLHGFNQTSDEFFDVFANKDEFF